ncbi:MAG: type VI secretion system ATPase TssH [Planctomycetaceae bacterium]|nr:type VI secretion system ATPase TssH [Planctomycetaceae bacterium]
MDVSLKPLVGKLNETCRRSLEAAAGLCLSRTNYNVEIEHWLFKLLETTDDDLNKVLRQYEIDRSRVEASLTRAIDRLKTGNSRPPALSPQIVDLVRSAWIAASIEYGATKVRSGHLLVALLADRELRLVSEGVPEFARIPVDGLKKDLPTICRDSSENEASSGGADADIGSSGGGPARAAGTTSLDQYTIDLTAKAKSGKIDPVLGRDFEIRQLIDILMRRRQNNPILTGEAGVGKTAVVEGFALRIAEGDVPPPLKNVVLRTLDLGLLQAGAGVKGEFENRLKTVLEEVKASPRPVIMFIDEAHTLIGAGGQAGQGDAANLLKPALARGELRTIAATTWSEYKKYFEKDAALARRFQVVKVEEPDEPTAIRMLEGLAKTLEKHHGLKILNEAIEDAVRLSHRYIAGRQLPDKAVSLLDTSAARVALGNGATPAIVEDGRRRISSLETKIDILRRESASGGNHAERLAALNEELTEARTHLTAVEDQWAKEKDLVARIREIRQMLEESSGKTAESNGAPLADAKPPAATKAEGETPATGNSQPAAAQATLRKELQELGEQLRSIQGERPLMQPCVDSQSVAEVVSGWTGIPVGRMLTDEIKKVTELKERIEARVVGQSHALEAIAKRIQTARASLVDPRRPVGVFLLVGPSGVGKTETALSLAEILYGGERNMVTINMSEYQESHTVSGLKGSPPGYVGYGEGGVLTEAVRRRPYSVVLLDEIEKAHQDVMELFYQVFDKGMLEDGEGREIDFKNTIILATSNAGSGVIQSLCADPDTRPGPEALADALRPELLKVFAPAFLGRMTVVPYFALDDSVMRNIIELNLSKIAARLRENHAATLKYEDSVVNAILARCRDAESGARNVDHILTGTLLPSVSREILSRMAIAEPFSEVSVGTDEAGDFTYAIDGVSTSANGRAVAASAG